MLTVQETDQDPTVLLHLNASREDKYHHHDDDKTHKASWQIAPVHAVAPDGYDCHRANTAIIRRAIPSVMAVILSRVSVS
jgi:hypothetical protein